MSNLPSAKELRERERKAREELARKVAEKHQAPVRASFVEELEKKAKNPTHEIRVKEKPSVTAVQQELARRQLAKNHLLPFVIRTTPGYMAGWVHMDICMRLEKFVQQVANGESPRLILQLPPRAGKLIGHNTPVLTTEGWKTHGELKVGDKVFHPNGHPVSVVALSGELPVEYKVTTTHGETIECHGAHEWTVYSRSSHKWHTYETREMAEGIKTRNGTKVGVVYSGVPGKRGGRYTFQLPNVAPLQFPRAENLVVDPYTLGAWLGDGSKGKPCITGDKADIAIIDSIAETYDRTATHVHAQTGVVTYYFSGPKPGVSGELGKGLQSLGVYNDKFIPEEYQRASIEQRLELLAGLLDTDGHHDKTGRYQFTTADKRLADGVEQLATGLGFRPYVLREEPRLSTSGIQGRKPYWKVVFQPTMQIPCRLPRKQNTRIAKQRKVAIASIEKVKDGQMGRCIQVDSPDGLYLVGRKLVPTHNSELASIKLPAWALGHHPRWDIIATSYAASLAEGFSRKARDLLTLPEYTTVFDTRLDADAKSVQSWRTDKGGTYNAAGVGGGIVGKGAHMLIIDDPFANKESAWSETNRDAVWDWYTTAAYTRLAPGGGVLIIMQRWHEDDLAGRLIKRMNEDPEADQFEVVHYPAIAEEDEPYRKAGEALHPERYDLKKLIQIKRNMAPSDWEALYQQNPTMADGDYFTREMFHNYSAKDRPPLSSLAIYQAWDLAIGQKETNDFSVGVAVGVDENDNHYVLAVKRGRWGSFELVENILDFAEAYSPRLIGIETSQIEMSIGPILNKRMRERKQFFALERLKPGRRDKMMRARSLQGRMQQGMVRFDQHATWFQNLQNEMLAFPAGKNDDQVDALAYVYLMLETMTTPYTPPPAKKKSWRDKLNSLTKSHSTGASAMSA